MKRGQVSIFLTVALTGMALAYLLTAAWQVSKRSLWLDELHTAWAVSAPWSQVPALSGGGNQQPYYFAAVKPFYATVGWFGVRPEVALRLPSILAWLAVLGGLLWAVRRLSWGGGAAILVAGLVVLDQRQLFYGTEARLYMVQQFSALIGWLATAWLCVARAQGDVLSGGDRTSKSCPGISNSTRVSTTKVACLWACTGAILCLLHLASLPVVFCQAGCLVFARICARHSTARGLSTWQITCVVAVPAVAAMVALTSDWWLWPPGPWETTVWQRRDNWKSFAGGSSTADFLRALPVHWFVLPALAALAGFHATMRLSSLFGRRPRVTRSVESGTEGDAEAGSALSSVGEVAFWLFAALAPALLVWLAAWLEVAPMLHQRYLISCYAPLILASAAIVARVPSALIRLTTAALVLVTLVCMQGSVALWKGGSLVPWQRVEGWRQASRFVSEQFSDGDRLWVSSGLIEAVGQVPPLQPEVDRYLSFPLRSIYQVEYEGQLVVPHALLNSSAFWLEQFRDDRFTEDDALQGAGNVSETDNWIVFRGPPAMFQSVLAKLTIAAEGRIMVVQPPKGFGSVSVAKLRVFIGR